ncbi:MAG: hypothetical protein DWQ04_24530 [Chloroflexi bacterium]|nr:MAG: hypothetical protein DWQ04_24530 [Chloroflexota bacterium]
MQRIWQQLPERLRLNLNDTFQPENIYDRMIPGEEEQLKIQMAWYRDILGHLMLHHFRIVLLITILAALIIVAVSFVVNFHIVYALVPFGLLLALYFLGGLERFEYLQYRLLKTNARLIISIPQHGAWPLVDNIEIKGAPSILDTNWSPNPIWRIFQFFTGARDLYISMSGLQFAEGRAKVKDALIIPDIMPEDVFELKKLVFIPK